MQRGVGGGEEENERRQRKKRVGERRGEREYFGKMSKEKKLFTVIIRTPLFVF